MKVEVYKNLHKNCWSVRNNKTGRVIDYVDSIHIEDATLVVRPAGRARVLKEHKKNVHAFIRGELTDDRFMAVGLVKVIYNPYEYDHFIRTDNGEAIYEWDKVLFTIHGAYIGTDTRNW